jgi:hypothetical protein
MTYSPTTVSARHRRVGDRFETRSAHVLSDELALAGPSVQVPKVLPSRNWISLRALVVARKLDVTPRQAQFVAVPRCEETLRWLHQCDLDQQKRRNAQLAPIHKGCGRNVIAGLRPELLSTAGPLMRSSHSGATGETAAVELIRRSAEGF